MTKKSDFEQFTDAVINFDADSKGDLGTSHSSAVTPELGTSHSSAVTPELGTSHSSAVTPELGTSHSSAVTPGLGTSHSSAVMNLDTIERVEKDIAE